MTPVEIIQSARELTDDRFAYGQLLRVELYLTGKTLIPAKFLPQSVPAAIDYDRIPARVSAHRYRYPGTREFKFKLGRRAR